ncbi:MAG: BrnA antitoxin family protein [Natronospirillum sp.]|uniref:BrnA antitoxin family protein n=1 Tax=Natronospirillum sp. TaxID=2812955 RepID=UPI0025E50B9C|nr:BrnA antitoxin family protein [Natronospirillum sp.]MCH8552917.1 BrnA antitoxin family protein [Natronospirillum sp.]
MKTPEERKALDDFDLPDEVDFSGAVRGRFYKPRKVSTTIRIDNDVLLFLKKKAAEEHVGYQTLINSLLREYVKHSVHESAKGYGAQKGEDKGTQ